MTPKEQLDLWVQGNSIHNLERNECTPDMSCCNHPWKWPQERREQFANATDDVRITMCGLHLQAVVPQCNFTVDDEAMVLTAIRDL
jgi:hypothetical protein